MLHVAESIPAPGQDGSDVTVKVASDGAAGTSGATKSADNDTSAEVTIRAQPWCGRYTVPSPDFTTATVGAKSLNTVRLQVQVACPRLKSRSLRTLYAFNEISRLLHAFAAVGPSHCGCVG